MGCSSILEELKYKDDIINVLISLYENELEIKSLLKEQNIKEYKSEKYILVNKYWVEDYKQYFGYKNIIQIINPNIKEKDYSYYKKIKESIIKKIYNNEDISAFLIKSTKDKYLLKSITTKNRAQNKFVGLNNGKASIPEIHTTLIKSVIFYEMIETLNNFIGNQNFKIENDIIEANVVIANKNIYLNIDNNRYPRYNIKNNLITCFLDGKHLRTKYFICFEQDKNFDQIINEYIKENKLEKYLKKNRYNLIDINCQDIRNRKYKIGYFFNLIKNNENEIYNNINDINSKNRINNSYNLIESQSFNGNNIINENISNEIKQEDLMNISGSNKFNKFNDEQSFSEKQSSKQDEKNKSNLEINNPQNANINININNVESYTPKGNNNRNNNQNNNIQNSIINININNLNNNNDQKQINYNIIINNNNIEAKFPIQRITKFSYNNFINEFIQCLSNVDILRQFFIENEMKINEEIKNYTPFSMRFINTIKYIYNMNYDSNKLLNEDFFKVKYKNSDNKISSFITFLFNSFTDELKELKIPLKKSNINEILFGERRISYECNHCQDNGGEREKFCYLEYDLLKVFEYNKKLNKDIKSITLKDCFNYNKTNSDNFYCKCGNNNFKNYSYNIYNLPEIVIIIVENGNINLIKKTCFRANTLIDNENDKIGYELISQINVKENNKYISFLKLNNNENKWYICEDNNIMEYNKRELDKGFPFVMIYSKVNELLMEKYIDELDNIIDLKNEKIDLLFYSTVSKIKEKIDDLEYDMKLEDAYNELCQKYSFENRTILFFNNSRKLDIKKTIRENKLENGDLIIIVEYNYI